MELESVLTLIDAVSESALTSFTLDDGTVKLSFGADRRGENAYNAEYSFDKETDVIKSGIIKSDRTQSDRSKSDRIKSDKIKSDSIESDNIRYDNSKQAEDAIYGGKRQENNKENAELKEGKKVNSPLVGIFYSSPSPEAESYVQIGDVVKKGQVLGIVEAMKLMNEIESEYDGVIKQILVDNEQLVEYGQPMFVIE